MFENIIAGLVIFGVGILLFACAPSEMLSRLAVIVAVAAVVLYQTRRDW